MTGWAVRITLNNGQIVEHHLDEETGSALQDGLMDPKRRVVVARTETEAVRINLDHAVAVVVQRAP